MKNLKFPRTRLLLSFVVCAAVVASSYVSPAASGQDEDKVRAQVGRALSSFDRFDLDPSAALKAARQSGRLRLPAAGGDLELELEPFDVRAADWRGVVAGEGGATREMERAPLATFRGKVRGESGSQVRLVLDGAKVEGVIVREGETFFVERASNYSPAAKADAFVLYPESAIKQQEFGECGTTLAHRVGREAARADASGADAGKTTAAAVGGDTPAPNAFAPRPELELATEADFEYFQFFGGATAAQNEISQIVAMVDGIYEAQLGIEIRIVFSRVWDNAGDPYTTTNAGDALNQFRTSYNNSFGGSGPPARDLTHMWTGKDFDGSTIGIAYSSVVCDAPSFSYGISQRNGGASTRVVLTAHEMGHNFGADHPDELTPAPDMCAGTIMNSSVTPNTSFCPFSKDQITNYTSAFGSCLSRLTQPGCTYALSTASQFFSADGGSASVGVSATAGCAWDVAEGAPWLTVTAGAPGSGPGSASYTVSPNTGGPRSVVADIAGQRLTVSQAASPNCGMTLVGIGQTINGDLASADCRSGQTERPSAAVDLYAFTARAGQRIRIEMNAATPPPAGLDTYLYLFGPDGKVIAENDDIVLGQQTNSRIPLNGFFELPTTGVYVISATSFDNNETGAYTLTLSDNSAASSVSFSSPTYAAGEGTGGGGIGAEGAGLVTVMVNRAGDLTGTATVDYAVTNGTTNPADRRRDFIQSLGTLVFAPGEASKTFQVLLTDDLFAEGAETVNLTLSNPVGTTISSPAAVLNVNDNDAATGVSPVKAENFNPAFFVRQQYLDFLNREPDAAGLAFWSGQFAPCDQLPEAERPPCRRVRRVNVSAAFFLSIEFQETGYLVYRFYKAAFGDINPPAVPVPVRLEEFLPDTQRIGQGVRVGIGDWVNQLEANKAAFAEEFVIRPRFLAAYPLTRTPEQFVDGLNAAAGGALSDTERNTLINELRTGQKTRGAVLRAVAEDSTLGQAEFNRAFVLMQYYGYLRRNPNDLPDADFSGYNFWLGQLNRFGGNFEQAEMVRAFIESIEYTGRFGN
jgi:hypothetical protein